MVAEISESEISERSLVNPESKRLIQLPRDEPLHRMSGQSSTTPQFIRLSLQADKTRQALLSDQ